MDKEYALSVAKTIWKQLFGTVGFSVIASWGAKDFHATRYKGMPALFFKVNGRLFKGAVIITLNEGTDYYEVYLRDINGKVECISDEVAFDELGDQIDRHIESGDNAEQYEAFCSQELQKLIQGAV